MYDPCKSRRLTADANDTIPEQAKVHKIVLINGTLTATAAVALHDAVTVTGDPVAEVRANEVTDGGAAAFAEYSEANFPRPLYFEFGVSANLTGTGAVVYIYYTL